MVNLNNDRIEKSKIALDHFSHRSIQRSSNLTRLAGVAVSAFLLMTAASVRDRNIDFLLFLLSGTSLAVAKNASRQYHRVTPRVQAHESAAEAAYKRQLVEDFGLVRSGFYREVGQQPLALSAASGEEIEDVYDPDQEFLDYANSIEDPVGQGIVSVLGEVKIKTELLGIERGLAFDRYLLKPYPGIDPTQIEKKSKNLMVLLSTPDEPLIRALSGSVAIDVEKDDRQFTMYEDYFQLARAPGLWAIAGVDQIKGDLVEINFADSNQPHLLVGGMTGSGKSEFLRSLYRSVADRYTPEEVKFLWIDPKMSTFVGLDFDHTIGKKPVTHAPAAIISLAKMVALMEKRRSQRADIAKDIDDYNQVCKSGQEWARILICVEEIKDLFDSTKTMANEELDALSLEVSSAMNTDVDLGTGKGKTKPEQFILMLLSRIGQAGRSEGIHLIGCTQQPNKKLLEDLISNFPVKVGLKLRSYIESNLIIPGENAKCEKLLGKGDFLLSMPGESLQRCQALYSPL